MNFFTDEHLSLYFASVSDEETKVLWHLLQIVIILRVLFFVTGNPKLEYLSLAIFSSLESISWWWSGVNLLTLSCKLGHFIALIKIVNKNDMV